MTRNQIDYFKAREEKRHNLATEQETNRSNVAREVETNRSNLAVESETNRHNLVVEGIQNEANIINRAHLERMDTENQRANQAREAETNRHNIQTESLQAQSNAEAARHNKTTENLTYVHNVVTEGIERDRAKAYKGSIDVAQQQADTAAYQAETQRDLAGSTIQRAVYQNRYDTARTKQLYHDMDLADEANTREWYNTYFNSIVKGTQAVKNVSDTVNQIINSIPGIGILTK